MNFKPNLSKENGEPGLSLFHVHLAIHVRRPSGSTYNESVTTSVPEPHLVSPEVPPLLNETAIYVAVDNDGQNFINTRAITIPNCMHRFECEND